MQPIIHQSQLSSVKIDTDAKGNAKPSVHVYNENPRVAMLDAADIYQKLRIQLGLDKIPLIDQEYAEVDEGGGE